MHIAAASPTDITYVRDLLAGAGLPIDDLEDSGKTLFLIARDDDRVIGAVGLDVYVMSGLLRSLVVNADERERGVGAQLTLNLERLAKSQGVDCLYLLTTTAEQFFAARGYRRFDRKRVPQDIAATTEFRLLCPASAVCMCKQLDE